MVAGVLAALLFPFVREAQSRIAPTVDFQQNKNKNYNN
jgi:hypothetical protein